MNGACLRKTEGSAQHGAPATRGRRANGLSPREPGGPSRLRRNLWISTMANEIQPLLLIALLGPIASAAVEPRVLLAEGTPSVSAPPGKAGAAAGWSEERMRKAIPIMPTVPGQPRPSGVAPDFAGPAVGAPAEQPAADPGIRKGKAKGDRSPAR